jgi:tetratricopeptide (TPR) repeat protein
MINIKEKSLEEVQEKLREIKTNLNKAEYLESALKKNISLETNRFILKILCEIYEQEKLFERAGRSYSQKARFDHTFKEKIEDFLKAGENFCKAGKIEEAEQMFLAAYREANELERKEIIKKRKESYLKYGDYFEKTNRKSLAVNFYEKVLNMKLNEDEKKFIKEKIKEIYLKLGRFKEAKEIENK